jgi:hypothetical protein
VSKWYNDILQFMVILSSMLRPECEGASNWAGSLI